VFSKILIRTGKGKVVDLAKEINRFVVEGGSVDASIVDSGDKAQLVENGVDVCFPKTTGFRVALKSMLNW
jgi:hypothetical protein